MKVLTIRQPWASLILLGYKDVENRTWKTSVRGKIAIHASQSKAKEDWKCAIDTVAIVYDFGIREAENWLEAKIGEFHELPRGVIIGTANLDDCTRKTTSPWHFAGNWGFYLSSVESLEQPIPMKGMLGFWEAKISGENS